MNERPLRRAFFVVQRWRLVWERLAVRAESVRWEGSVGGEIECEYGWVGGGIEGEKKAHPCGAKFEPCALFLWGIYKRAYLSG